MSAINNYFKKAIIIIFLTGCATKSYKSTIVRDMAIGAVAGSIYGHSFSNNKAAYSQMYAGIGAATAALISLGLNDPDSEIEQLKKTNEKLRTELDQFDNQSTVGSLRRGKVYSGTSMNGMNALPDKYKNLIKPGEWVLYEIDEWERIDDNRMVHKTEMLEIQPPILKSN